MHITDVGSDPSGAPSRFKRHADFCSLSESLVWDTRPVALVFVEERERQTDFKFAEQLLLPKTLHILLPEVHIG